jgi:hypothetical protein
VRRQRERGVSGCGSGLRRQPAGLSRQGDWGRRRARVERSVHRGENRGVGSGLDLGPGPVEKLEGWVGQWDTANGTVALGILLQFGPSCQCLFGRSGGAKNDTPGVLPTAVRFIENVVLA